MSKGKTGLIVLTILAAMFFLFIAVLYGSSTKRQGALDRKETLDDRLELILDTDLTIYWIGEVPKELEILSPIIQVIPSENVSKDNLPVQSALFHITEYNENGQIVSEETPKDYTRYMFIVISGTPDFTDSGKEALLDAVAKNGVPVFAIGEDASQTLGDILSYKRWHTGEGSSLYYCLGAGYKENPIPENQVKAGGYDLAEGFPDVVSLAMTDYTPQK